MGAGTLVLTALKAVGSWVLNNPSIALDAVDKVAKIQADKKAINIEEHLQVVDEKVNQLGAAALELDQKIDNETTFLRNELHAVCKQMRTMKIVLSVVGAVLGAAIISIILLAIF